MSVNKWAQTTLPQPSFQHVAGPGQLLMSSAAKHFLRHGNNNGLIGVLWLVCLQLYCAHHRQLFVISQAKRVLTRHIKLEWWSPQEDTGTIQAVKSVDTHPPGNKTRGFSEYLI